MKNYVKLAGILVAVLVVVALFEAREARREAALARGFREQAAAEVGLQERLAELQHLRAERDALSNRVAGLQGELAERRGDHLAMLKLRAEVTHWRQQAAAKPAETAPAAPADADPDDVSNARGVKLAGGQTLDFTNGVAVVRTSNDPTEASAQDTYTISRMLGSNNGRVYYEVGVNGGGSGTDESLGIFSPGADGSGKGLQLLSVGDRVEIYNMAEQDGGISVYYLDRAAGTGMASPPDAPTRTDFQLDPATGQYVAAGTYGLETQQPWVKKP